MYAGVFAGGGGGLKGDQYVMKHIINSIHKRVRSLNQECLDSWYLVFSIT